MQAFEATSVVDTKNCHIESTGDILRVPVLETYHNVVLKFLHFADWAANNFQFHFLTKQDDDVFLRVDALVAHLRERAKRAPLPPLPRLAPGDRRDAGDGRVAGLQRAEDGLVVEVARRERAGVEQRRRQSPALGPGGLRLGSRRVIRRPRCRLQQLRNANLL